MTVVAKLKNTRTHNPPLLILNDQTPTALKLNNTNRIIDRLSLTHNIKTKRNQINVHILTVRSITFK